MDIPSFLEGDVHVPLKEWTLTTDAIPLVNQFYLTSLLVGDFKVLQASRSSDGFLRLELISATTGDVVMRLVNKSPTAQTPVKVIEEWVVSNPLVVHADGVPWLGTPVAIHQKDELDFLDGISVGSTYPLEGTNNEVPRQLAALLNSYHYLGNWVSGTLGDLCTGGFKLIYKGVGRGDRDPFQMGESAMMAVIQVLHGSQKGYLCLRV